MAAEKKFYAQILKSTLALPPFFAGGLRLLQPPPPSLELQLRLGFLFYFLAVIWLLPIAAGLRPTLVNAVRALGRCPLLSPVVIVFNGALMPYLVIIGVQK